MMRVDHLIIGGGISGMYIAMQLTEQNKSFMIVDDHEKTHSKLETTKVTNGSDSENLEMGASVFHTRQHKLLKFIHYLKLDDKIKHLDDSSKYIVSSIPDIDQKFIEVKNRVKIASKTSGLMTIEELAKCILSDEEYLALKTGWDCWWENKDMNAYHFFSTVEGDYCKLEGGLKTLMKTAWELWENKFIRPYKLLSITMKNSQFFVDLTSKQDSQKIIAQHVYLCIGLEHLPSINWNEFSDDMKIYESLGRSLASIRYYIILNEEVDMMYDQIIGDIQGHWILKINKWVYMIYTDGDMANYLNSLSDKEIIEGWIKTVNKFLIRSIDASVVKRTIRGYWHNAFEVLLPKYYTTSVKFPFMITSLPTVSDQAWMNGHLYDIK